MKMNIMAKTLAAAVLSFGSVAASTAQTLEKMTWYNEPAKWAVSDGALLMEVTTKSDYWRISHYGFTVDDAPFYYATYGGEFEAKVKITGDYQARFDQAGLMVRIDHENYIKAGIEYVGGKYNLSVVVTHTTSDWSVITLDKPVESVFIRVNGINSVSRLMRQTLGISQMVILQKFPQLIFPIMTSLLQGFHVNLSL